MLSVTVAAHRTRLRISIPSFPALIGGAVPMNSESQTGANGNLWLGLMSVLGQKQTCVAQKAMSALPSKANGVVAESAGSKADSCSAATHVCFTPKKRTCNGDLRPVIVHFLTCREIFSLVRSRERMRQYHLSATNAKPTNIDRVHTHLATRFSCVCRRFKWRLGQRS